MSAAGSIGGTHRVRPFTTAAAVKPAERPRHMALRLAIGGIIAWGAFAFGAVYPWAYTPLLVMSAVAGMAALVLGRGEIPAGFAAGLALVLLAGLVQLVPLPASLLQSLSPATHRFLTGYDLAYAFGGHGQLSISPRATLLGLSFLIAFGTLAIGLSRLLTRSSARALAVTIVVIGFGLGFFGVVHRATFHGRIYGFWVPQMGGSPFGPFVNRNHFAGWMLMALPVAVGLFVAQISERQRRIRHGLRERLLWLGSPEGGAVMLVCFGIVIMALSLILSMSRSGMVSAAISLIGAAAFAATHMADRKRRVLVFAFLGAAIALAAIMAGPDRIQQRFAAADPRTMGGRRPMWSDAVRIAEDFYPFGTGLNTFGVATLMYQRSVPGQHLAEAHNDYLQLAAEGGLLLAVPIAVTLMAFARAVRDRLRQSDGPGYWVRVGALTGIAAVAFQSLAEFSLQMPGNAALFAVLCGIVLHGRRPSPAVSRLGA